MILSRLTACAALGAAVVLMMSASPLAYADGMPYGAKKSSPVVTPLDEALDEIQNKEPPIPVTEPVIEDTPPPAEEAKAPEPAPAPVPESRVVEVQPNTSFFGLSVGMYDPFAHNMRDMSFNLEWQPGVKVAGVLQPLFGAFMTTEGTMMGYGGIGVPFQLGERVFLMPSVSVGAYEEGDGYDLDRTLAFRVGTELAYQFDNKSRIGLNAHVISNGTSLGRDDRTEVISLVYTTPLDIFSGRNRSYEEAKPSSSAAAAPATSEADKAMSESGTDVNTQDTTTINE